MNKDEVIELIRPTIEGCTITEVEDFGDAFAVYFVNDEYYKSKRFEDMKVGAGPIIYIKNTGEIFRTGSGQSAKNYIKAYRECGDVYGRLSNTLEISGLPKNSDEKKTILNLKSIVGLGMAEAKTMVERIIKDGKAEVSLKNEWEAEEVLNKFLETGFKVKQLWVKAC
jgi:hypothetical protein